MGPSPRVHPPRPESLTRVDAVVIAAALLGSVGLAVVSVLLPGAPVDDPRAAAATRQALCDGLSSQALPVLSGLRQDAASLARVLGSTGEVPPGSARLYWLTDRRGRVIRTSPAASALLGRQRPVRPAGGGSVSSPLIDPILGGEVVVASARLRAGGAVSLAMSTTGVPALVSMPVVSGPTTTALLAPDGTWSSSDSARRELADPDISGASAQKATTGTVHYAGQGGAAFVGVVRQLGDGWVAVSTGAALSGRQQQRARRASAAVGAGFVALTCALLVFTTLRVRSAHRRGDAAQRAVLAVVGHELRTPLTSILGVAQTLTRGWSRLGDAQKQELVTTMTRQTRLLDRLVERLLHAGRLASGTALELDVVPVSVRDVVEAVFAEVRPSAPVHELTLQVAPHTPYAMADRRALTQVMAHLVENAVKFSPDGGPVSVSVAGAGRRGHVRIEVRDHGVGLPADTSRLFRPFGQSGQVNTRTTEEGGVGLGLSIARDLVEGMGGSIFAERFDPGTRLVVTLPGSAINRSD